ncbi:MAG TPA: hypothetical protein DCL61_33030 [Cyanobacteria bacterium UBA12227]|nr:hypothetical protein [Cyanobacteria bacterium UBA12227]HAX87973.1 hypothetical protein [Cyanobacteria bacterium UBA11370]HBY78151.1 hypothetical protein [Cyanobacteria bacterium UBA11148]
MKVGMIFECGPDGADKQVCEHLARMLQPDIEISSVTLDNKPNLLSECGATAAQLLEDGCDRIIIVWDLHPPWREKKQPPCLKEDRAAIMDSLAQAGVTSPHVHLVCIKEELEAWLLADGRAISAVLSKPTHPVKVKDKKNPEGIKNPKKQLNKIFQENTGRRYEDRQHAKMIVEKLEDLNKLRRSITFVRFAEKVAGVKL